MTSINNILNILPESVIIYILNLAGEPKASIVSKKFYDLMNQISIDKKRLPDIPITPVLQAMPGQMVFFMKYFGTIHSTFARQDKEAALKILFDNASFETKVAEYSGLQKRFKMEQDRASVLLTIAEKFDYRIVNRLWEKSDKEKIEILEAYLMEKDLTSIKSLNLTTYNLNYLPEDVLEKLTGLETLNLSEIPLYTFPKFILKLVELKTLSLSGCQIPSVPGEIENLQKLEYLILDHNQLSSFPSAILALKSLIMLDLSENAIKKIPYAITELSKLSHLYLEKTDLDAFPESICNMSSIGWLRLAENNISSIPKSVAKLKKLNDLNLFKNRITHVPEELNLIPSLEEITLIENPILTIPESLKDRCVLKD